MEKVKKVPLRKCVGCQEMFPKKELIRVVLTPEAEIHLDFTGKRNGRGAYLCKNPQCLQTAKKRKALDRALKTHVEAGLYDDLVTRLEEGLKQ